MCQQCKTKPVYEFTNKRKVCGNCFIKWFEKKFLYTLRKFEMVKCGDVVGYFKGGGFRDVVLENCLGVIAGRGRVKIVGLTLRDSPAAHPNLLARYNHRLIAQYQILSRYFVEENLLRGKQIGVGSLANNFKKSRAKQDKFKINRIAIPQTTDLIAYGVVNVIIKSDVKDLRNVKSVDKKIIRPLFLFLDKEVELYAKLKRLKFKKTKEKKDKVSDFVDGLERKHPEIKWAVVQSWLKIN
ncbi:hypothetical protein CMI44_01100 [Candidatus Pacearchaeota archaeon]|nr:hypothetical protein [Candidatus Pacearchaeota archaeon]